MKIMKKKSETKFSNQTNQPIRVKITRPTTFKIPIIPYSLISFGLAILISLNWFSVGLAQISANPIRMVRAPETGGPGIQNPAGLALLQDEYSLNVRVAASSDDAEEKIGGGVS